jgi:hypothetical protein
MLHIMDKYPEATPETNLRVRFTRLGGLRGNKPFEERCRVENFYTVA